MGFEVGQVVSDYEILSVLGKGGMGRVYRVRNVISNRIEAMKVLLADLAAEPELGDRFAGEIRTLARLDHQNIAKLHTAFKVENQLVMIMEFVEGFTLSERARQGAIPLSEILSYITQTLGALGYAHENGVVHRDIKPSNIMVTPHGVVKLMDFGIAKSNADTMHTRAGTTMGSMLYMSPEQVRGNTVDARSDLYSLGIVLYELTAGRRPFESDSTYAVLEAQLNATPRPPVEVNPALPKPLNDIIMTALEKEPMRRFQSAEAFRRALESVKTSLGAAQAATISARPAAAMPATPPALPNPNPPGKTGSNRGLWMALGAIACVLVLIGAAIAMPHFWRGKAATVVPVAKATVATNQPSPAKAPDQAGASVAPTPSQPVSQPAPQNQPVNSTTQAVQSVAVGTAQAVQRVAVGTANEAVSSVSRSSLAPEQKPQETGTTSAAVPPPVPVQAPPVPVGPSQEEIDKVQESLMQLHSRADAMRSSVGNLRRQQAAEGLEVSPEIAGAASRMDNYLQAADRAAQSNDLTAARKYMDGAEKQLAVLEAKFGR